MAHKKLFKRLMEAPQNYKIIIGLSVQANDHITVNGLYDNFSYFDLKEWFQTVLKGSRLLKSLLPQQRRPFINGLTEYTYNEIFCDN